MQLMAFLSLQNGFRHAMTIRTLSVLIVTRPTRMPVRGLYRLLKIGATMACRTLLGPSVLTELQANAASAGQRCHSTLSTLVYLNQLTISTLKKPTAVAGKTASFLDLSRMYWLATVVSLSASRIDKMDAIKGLMVGNHLICCCTLGVVDTGDGGFHTYQEKQQLC